MNVSHMGNLTDQGKVQISILKLTDTARSFRTSCSQLHEPDLTWQKLKEILSEGIRGTHTDQFHCMELQAIKQKKGEHPLEFEGRCYDLCNKPFLIRKT
jgi:hypothetical protein